jgi:CRISPR-associated endonuclease/helicase Cas3
MKYNDFFSNASGCAPHTWQAGLGTEASCEDRLLRVPTGFGKTLGVLNAWLYNRVERNDDSWPRRLVWCLPMRVLVEQTQAEVTQVLTRVGKLWAPSTTHQGKVGVHLLMGGANAGDWHLYPEHNAVLIGTQDMLLSRALNRGYGSYRARWPIDFGLLNQDCLWVMDEVQLMDVGLATSGQLQAFRRTVSAEDRLSRPCRTWWMSATLQRDWLAKSPETTPMAREMPQTSIPARERIGHLWDDVHKPIRVEATKDDASMAKLVAEAHIAGGQGKDGPTLLVVNRVDAAISVYSSLKKDKRLKDTDVRLIHSRFRPRDREGWRAEFLNRHACNAGTNRIIVATQVVEAGVDMSASVLVTELAPWSSLVQRFGRAARWGGHAQLIVLNRQVKDDKAAAPYQKAELDAALSALHHLDDGSPLALERFEEQHPELLDSLYPYSPRHLLLSHELDDLFDTTADLSGADIDISRFIRSGEERDVQVFWFPVPTKEKPNKRLRPQREALCNVPFLKAREWLCDKGTQLKTEMRRRAWVWDWLDGEWRVLEAKDVYPGQTILVDSSLGGYDPVLGFRPSSKEEVPFVTAAEPSLEDQTDAEENDEHLSVLDSTQPVVWQTIAGHGAQVGKEARKIANLVCPKLSRLFDLAGRWHDLGKAHEAFQSSIVHEDRPDRLDLAKAPKDAWPRHKLYSTVSGTREGFRHELASTLALFGVLRRHMPEHPALLGPWREALLLLGAPDKADRPQVPPTDLEKEILALSAEDFDLLAYLVCSHHGKVRLTWHASPADQKANDSVTRIRGVREGDRLPTVELASANGNYVSLPETELCLSPAAVGLSLQTGRSWTERTLGLIRRHSVFELGYLEAILRAADVRASRTPIADSLISQGAKQ